MRRALLLLLILASHPTHAQETPEPPAQFQVVSFTANVPGAPLGFGFYRFDPGSVGFFAEGRVMPALPPERDIYDHLTPEEVRVRFGDRQTGTRTLTFVGNAGATFALGRSAGLYAGAGLAYHSDYYSYRDPSYILGTNGTYWVPGPSRIRPNVVGGVILPVSRAVTLQLGGELEPAGVVAGVGMRL